MATSGSFQETVNKWNDWICHSYLANHPDSFREACKKFENRSGVYIIRASRPLRRVHRESDVVYIGKSGKTPSGVPRKNKNPQGVKGRLLNARGVTEMLVRTAIEARLKSQEFTIACHYTTPGEDPGAIEWELLEKYLSEFTELPPANHSLPREMK